MHAQNTNSKYVHCNCMRLMFCSHCKIPLLLKGEKGGWIKGDGYCKILLPLQANTRIRNGSGKHGASRVDELWSDESVNSDEFRCRVVGADIALTSPAQRHNRYNAVFFYDLHLKAVALIPTVVREGHTTRAPPAS